MIRVLVVDDSQVITLLLKAMIDQEDDMEVIGIAYNGQEAIEKIKDLKPDIVTMDIRMPIMDGFKTTRIIMSEMPTPIVVVSASVNDDELRIAFKAIEEGALAVIEKPSGLDERTYNRIREDLINHLRALHEIKLMRRRVIKTTPNIPITSMPEDGRLNTRDIPQEIIAIGASTGGPIVIEKMLSELPVDFPSPIVIVQHIAQGFVTGFVKWLDECTSLPVKLATHGEVLQPGSVYIAPNGQHLKLKRVVGKIIEIALSSEPENMLFTPSVDVFFDSVAKVCPGHAMAGLLTGMGSDGAEGLKSMRNKNCQTFIQDERSSVIFGMPGSAQKLGAARDEVSADNLATYLIEHVYDIRDTRKERR